MTHHSFSFRPSFVLIALCAWLLPAGLSADNVTKRTRSGQTVISGKIANVDMSYVTISIPEGGQQRISRADVVHVQFDPMPSKFREAEKARQGGDWEKAIKYFGEVSSSSAKAWFREWALFRNAQIHSRRLDWEQASQSLDLLLKDFPNGFWILEAHQLLATAHIENKEWDKAKALVNSLKQLGGQKGDLFASLVKARVALQQSDFGTATDSASRVISASKNSEQDLELYLEAASLALMGYDGQGNKQNQMKKLLTDLEKKLKKFEQVPANGLGIYYAGLGDLEHARGKQASNGSEELSSSARQSLEEAYFHYLRVITVYPEHGPSFAHALSQAKSLAPLLGFEVDLPHLR